jgi:stress response protein SCP2
MASINLVKGGRVDLYKEAPSLKKIGVGLGWDANSSDTGKDFDLDASAFMLSANGKVPASEFFIFYNNLKIVNTFISAILFLLNGITVCPDKPSITIFIERPFNGLSI